jgi:hypothetical protein
MRRVERGVLSSFLLFVIKLFPLHALRYALCSLLYITPFRLSKRSGPACLRQGSRSRGRAEAIRRRRVFSPLSNFRDIFSVFRPLSYTLWNQLPSPLASKPSSYYSFSCFLYFPTFACPVKCLPYGVRQPTPSGLNPVGLFNRGALGAYFTGVTILPTAQMSIFHERPPFFFVFSLLLSLFGSRSYRKQP